MCDIIIQCAVSILVALICWYSGGNIEKKKHLHNLDYQYRMEVTRSYQSFIGQIRKLVAYTGGLVNQPVDFNKLKEDKFELLNIIDKMNEAASNPFILKDKHVEECSKKMHEGTSSLINMQVCKCNGKNVDVDCEDIQEMLMCAVKQFEMEIAD